MSKGKRVIECNIEHFVSVVPVTKQKAVLSIEFSTVKENLEREQEVDPTHQLQKTNVQRYGSRFIYDKEQTVGIILTILWFFLKEMYTVTHQLAFFGKENLRKCWIRMDGSTGMRFSPKPVVQEINDDRGGWRKRPNERKTVVGCKDNTSNDPFSRCESVQQFDYRWNWRSKSIVWLQVHNWTRKFKRKELCTWYCVCVVKPSRTPMTTWQPRPRPTSKAHETLHLTWTCVQSLCLFSLVLLASAHSWIAHHIAWLKGVAHVISSMHEVCGYPSTLISILFHFLIFPFILNLLQFLLHFFHYLEGRSKPLKDQCLEL